MRHFMNLQKGPFESIRSGTKDIELRLYDDKRRKINKGDIIEFNHEGEIVEVVVLNLHLFNSFKELYASFDKVRFGYKEDEVAHPSDMEQYYPREEIEKSGVVGIEIMLLNKVNNAILTDNGICPTCFDKNNNHVLFGDDKETLIYKDDLIECFFVGNPRARGHVAISSVNHYKDMMDITDDLCDYVFKFSKKMMNIIKEVFESESVYLATMCDGPMNHFHIQLIPRYSFEKRGSTNFVKERFSYTYEPEKMARVKELIGTR